MTFLLRFLGWSLLLGLPAWGLGEEYRRVLARTLEATLAALGQRVTLERVDAIAPMDLVLYAALTLASDVWGWRPRLQALLGGGAALVVVQIVLWTAAVGGVMAAAAGAPAPPAVERLANGALSAAGWLAAVTVWMIGPGSAMLDRASGRVRPRTGPAKRSQRTPGGAR